MLLFLFLIRLVIWNQFLSLSGIPLLLNHRVELFYLLVHLLFLLLEKLYLFIFAMEETFDHLLLLIDLLFFCVLRLLLLLDFTYLLIEILILFLL